MTPQILCVLAILTGSLLLALWGRVRMDMVALLIAGALAVFGILDVREALSGFSNPATVTIWAMFVLSGSLSRVGIASGIAKRLIGFGPRSEIQMVLMIMLSSAIVSAFMNNVAVVALLLPVVMDLTRQSSIPPSRLLLPLSVGASLGGCTTLIGTSPNMVVSEVLAASGYRPFDLFSFAPVGVAIAASGIAFLALFGRRLLPTRDPERESGINRRANPGSAWEIGERLFVLELPERSALAGRTLADSRLGSVLGVNVIAVIRDGKTHLAPNRDQRLEEGDRLVVGGRLEGINELRGWKPFDLEKQQLDLESLVSDEIGIAEAVLAPSSTLVGENLSSANFRRRFDLNVLAIRRGDRLWRSNLQHILVAPRDILLVQGRKERVEEFCRSSIVESFRWTTRQEVQQTYALEERLFLVSVPPDSHLAGHSLAESRLGLAFGLSVLGIIRAHRTRLMPDPDEPLQSGDRLLIAGRTNDSVIIEGLQALDVTHEFIPSIAELESDHIGMQEVVLSPYSPYDGKTLRQIRFRERFGLNVLAVLRGSKVFRADVAEIPLRFGDALLLYGPREKLEVLISEAEFLALSRAIALPPRSEKAVIASAIMLGTLGLVLAGFVHISIATVIGSALMVATGCVTMDEAYRFISWRVIFLVAGMIPLGIALEKTGTASLLASGLVETAGATGTHGLLIAMFLVSFLIAQVVPPPAAAILLAPVAIQTATALSLSPAALVLCAAYAVSVGFIVPITQPGNVMVMGPGGYSQSDYLRLGLPLSLLVMVVVVILVPVIFPL